MPPMHSCLLRLGYATLNSAWFQLGSAAPAWNSTWRRRALQKRRGMRHVAGSSC